MQHKLWTVTEVNSTLPGAGAPDLVYIVWSSLDSTSAKGEPVEESQKPSPPPPRPTGDWNPFDNI